MTDQRALDRTEARMLAEVQRGYNLLRERTDPRGHDLLAALEQAHLDQIVGKYEYARKAIGLNGTRTLRLVMEEEK